MLSAFLLFIHVLIKQSIPQYCAKWRLKYRLCISRCSTCFQQLRFCPTVAVENNVPVTPQDFRPRASSDNQPSTSRRRRSYCCQELDLESQKDQPHVKAILQDHDWNTIATALVYLHKHSTFLGNINAYETCILNLKFKRIYSVVVQIWK